MSAKSTGKKLKPNLTIVRNNQKKGELANLKQNIVNQGRQQDR